MSAITGSAHSRYAGLLPIEPSDDFYRPIDLKPEDVPLSNGRPSPRKRRGLGRFLIAFCTCVAATLLWQSYGDAAREMIANSPQRLGWLAARAALTAQSAHPPVGIDAMAQNADKIAIAIAGVREPGSTDQITTGQEQATPSTGQAAASVDEAPAARASTVTVESRDDAASLQRTAARFTEARPPQTLAELGKPLSAASGHVGSCFASASAVLQDHPGAWPTWTLKAPGHEGITCWFAAARPRGSDHRSRPSDHRNDMTRNKEIVGTAEDALSAPLARRGSAGAWDGGQP